MSVKLTQIIDLKANNSDISEVSSLLKSLKDLELKGNPVSTTINQFLGKETKRFPNKKEVKVYLKSLP
jgi:hypothetical protein